MKKLASKSHKWKYGFTMVPEYGTNMTVPKEPILGENAFSTTPYLIRGTSGGMGLGATARSALANPRTIRRPILFERRQMSQVVTTGGDRRW